MLSAKRTIARCSIAAVIACTLLGAGLTSAGAVEVGATSIQAEAEAGAERDAQPVGYVIAQADAKAQKSDGSMFYATGPISADTLVVIPNADGSLPGNLSISAMNEAVQEARRSGQPLTLEGTPNGPESKASSYAYSAYLGSWSQAWNGSSLIGGSASTQTTYSFRVKAGFNQRNAGQGLGYYRGYNGGTLGVWSQWYGAGTATGSGTGYTTVPWGNVAAVKKFRAQCLATAACGGYFTT